MDIQENGQGREFGKQAEQSQNYQPQNPAGNQPNTNQEQEDWSIDEPSINDENVENGVAERYDKDEDAGSVYDREERGDSQYDREEIVHEDELPKEESDEDQRDNTLI
jgi:hypothetical protein